MRKIVFYGKSGVGKSTICKKALQFYKENGKSVDIIKLAYPLYVIQKMFYDTAQIDISFYDQNQKLLESIAAYLREINPYSIISDFNKRLAKSTADVVINDDLRDTKIDYPIMQKSGFIFIRITCAENIRKLRLEERNDLNTVFCSKTTDYLDEIRADYVIDTSAEDKSVAQKELYKILKEID